MTPEEKIKHEKAILKVIENNNLMRFSHIFGKYKSISRATAYNNDLDKLDSIKDALEGNRDSNVDLMLQKWIKSDNPTLQIAAMRLICTPEERQNLNQSYIDHTSGGEKIQVVDPFKQIRDNAGIDEEAKESD